MDILLLEKEINNYLESDKYPDAVKNGLQIEGLRDCKKIISGVSFDAELILQAVKNKADALLVHHGIFKNDVPSPFYLHGIIKNRLKLLLENNLSLFCWHLPLDNHKQTGTNASLAEIFGLYDLLYITNGCIGKTTDSLKQMQTAFSRYSPCSVFCFNKARRHTVAIVSGAGSSMLEQCSRLGITTFITGEIKESAYAAAKELKINLLILGHYASEMPGIKSLGNYIKINYPVEVIFKKNNNPF